MVTSATTGMPIPAPKTQTRNSPRRVPREPEPPGAVERDGPEPKQGLARRVPERGEHQRIQRERARHDARPGHEGGRVRIEQKGLHGERGKGNLDEKDDEKHQDRQIELPGEAARPRPALRRLRFPRHRRRQQAPEVIHRSKRTPARHALPPDLRLAIDQPRPQQALDGVPRMRPPQPALEGAIPIHSGCPISNIETPNAECPW